MFWFRRIPRWRSEKRRVIDERAVLRLKLRLFQVVILVLFLLLVGQLWRLQLVEGSWFRQKAEHNRLRLLPLPAKRGVIYDRNGVLLVRNIPSFTVAVVPADLPVEQQGALAAALSNLLEMPADEIVTLIDKQRAQRRLFEPLPLKTAVPRETALIIRERQRELPGVQVLIEPLREYLEGPLTAHLIGYVRQLSPEDICYLEQLSPEDCDEVLTTMRTALVDQITSDEFYSRLQAAGYEVNDRIGKMGVERSYEEVLRGKRGQEWVEVNANGQKLRSLAIRTPLEPGDNLVLSIDIELQREMTKLLAEGMGESKYGVAIVMNPQSGEILGMVSLPTYDPAVFSGKVNDEQILDLLEDPLHPLVNNAISGTFPPGSIFKIITGTAALQEGVATPQTVIVSRGQITIPNQFDPSIVYTFKDWAVLGALDFYRAIAMSSDVYFYYLAGGYQDFRGLGIERLAKHADLFGLGQLTGIDLPGEVTRPIPDPKWKERTLEEPWLKGDTYHAGIGQGYWAVTPLQMLNMVAVVANGGTLYQPQVVREVVDEEGNVIVPFQKRVLGQLEGAAPHLAVVAEGMRQAAASGTARTAKLPGVTVAGKTGTAEFPGFDPATGKLPTHGWFVGFAPFENPEIAVVVFVERGNGALNAAPIAKDILKFYFQRQEALVAQGGGDQ